MTKRGSLSHWRRLQKLIRDLEVERAWARAHRPAQESEAWTDLAQSSKAFFRLDPQKVDPEGLIRLNCLKAENGLNLKTSASFFGLLDPYTGLRSHLGFPDFHATERNVVANMRSDLFPYLHQSCVSTLNLLVLVLRNKIFIYKTVYLNQAELFSPKPKSSRVATFSRNLDDQENLTLSLGKSFNEGKTKRGVFSAKNKFIFSLSRDTD